METYRIGAIIREERIRKNISQEELCEGICASATLSRIESGAQKPSLKVEEALLERLGHNTENLVIYAAAEEVEKHYLESEIRIRLAHRREDIEPLLTRYMELLAVRGSETVLEKQFVQMTQTIQAMHDDKVSWREIRDKLLETIRLTIPDYDEECFTVRRLYTNMEIQLLNNLAIVYAKQKKTSKAISLFRFLVEYIEKNEMDVETKNKTYPMLVYNLICLLEDADSMQEIGEYAEKGIAYCLKYGRLYNLPDFVYYSGLFCQNTGSIEEAVKKYRQAVSLLELSGRMESAEYLQKEIDKLQKTSVK